MSVSEFFGGLEDAAKSALGGGVGSVVSSVFGSATKPSNGTLAAGPPGNGPALDAWRVARRDKYLKNATAGNVTAARYLIGGFIEHTIQSEHPLYIAGVEQLSVNRPDILAAARELGPLNGSNPGYGDEDGITADKYIQAEWYASSGAVPDTLVSTFAHTLSAADIPSPLQKWASSLVSQLRKDVAGSVQNLGAGATDALAHTIDPNSKAVTVPTSWPVLVGVALLVIALLYFALRGRR